MAEIHGKPAGKPVFVKQYGYYRTGTNYIEAILPRNFHCIILRNVLGCKHDPPRDWAVELTREKGELPKGLRRAVDRRRVRTLVSIKNPYAWMDSFQRFWKWKVKTGAAHRKLDRELLRERCIVYSRCCSRWVQHVRTRGGVVVKYEDLITNYAKTLKNVGKRLQLVRLHPEIVQIERRIDPHKPLRQQPFDPTYYSEHRYLDNLSDVQKSVVHNNTDWKLFERYGYKKKVGAK